MYKYDMRSDKDLSVLRGVCQGFHVVDNGCDLNYKMQNYKSILVDDMQKQMCSNIAKELYRGQISCLPDAARCVHAMGAVQRRMGVCVQ